MSTYKIMTRLMLKFDLKDWSTIVFTFIFPVALLIVFRVYLLLGPSPQR